MRLALIICAWPATPPDAFAFPYTDGPQLPDDTLVRTPWHMTNVRVDFDQAPGDFDTFCVTFRIEGSTAPNVNFYFSPFNSRINRLLFYGGIQTHIDGLRSDGRFVRRNKGAIFSRWQERDTDAIMPADGGLSRSLGNEGDFISVRNDFSWDEGRYRLCLRKSEKVDGDPLPDNYDADDIAYAWGKHVHTWVRMEATDLDSGATTFIGALAIPGAKLALRNYNILFAEIYGSPNPFNAERVPDLTIAVENFQVDGKELSYRRVSAASNTIPADGGEPNMTRIRYERGSKAIRMELGRFTGRFGRISTAVHPAWPAVESVSLVSADGHGYVRALWDGREVDKGQLPSGGMNIEARPVDNDEVASVRLELSGPISLSRLISGSPYLISGQSQGLTLPEGDYRITATPFSRSDGQGLQGPSLDAEFSVVSAPLPTGIDDENLLTHVESALDATLTEDNIQSEMESLENLVIANGEISNLEGLQLARNLQVLKLPGNRIHDLAPLSGLRKMTELDLSGNRIEDLTPLCDLLDIRRLNLDDNKISDLSPLAGLPAIELLSAGGNEISDLESISALGSLRRLELAGNGIRSLGPLASLAGLEVLDISENFLEDLSPLSALLALRQLSANANQVSDAGPLAGLFNLRRLDISRNPLSELGPLAGLPELTYLAANGNGIFRIEPLSGLLALRRLELESNWIAHIGPLAGLQDLEVLYVRHNRIDDFSSLNPLIEQGLEVIGLADQLRAIMERPGEFRAEGEF